MYKGPPLVGLSLSFCVTDILRGCIALEDVTKLVTGTQLRDEADWEKCLGEYCQTYWRDDPLEALAIVRQLRESGRIEQPRLENEAHYPLIYAGNWVTSSDQGIIWSDLSVGDGREDRSAYRRLS